MGECNIYKDQECRGSLISRIYNQTTSPPFRPRLDTPQVRVTFRSPQT